MLGTAEPPRFRTVANHVQQRLAIHAERLGAGDGELEWIPGNVTVEEREEPAQEHQHGGDAAAREEAQREATKGRDSRPGTAIALRNKDIELKDFYRQTSEARGTWRATSATAGYSSAARRAGDRAGRRARLGTSPELGGARSALGR